MKHISVLPAEDRALKPTVSSDRSGAHHHMPRSLKQQTASVHSHAAVKMELKQHVAMGNARGVLAELTEESVELNPVARWDRNDRSVPLIDMNDVGAHGITGSITGAAPSPRMDLKGLVKHFPQAKLALNQVQTWVAVSARGGGGEGALAEY